MLEQCVRLGLVFVAGLASTDGLRVAWAKCSSAPSLVQELELVGATGARSWPEEAELELADFGEEIGVEVSFDRMVLRCATTPEVP